MNDFLTSLLRTRKRRTATFATLVVSTLIASMFALTSATTASGQEVTIWGESAPLNVTATASTGAVELGTRFTPTTDGAVTAIRFFKASGTSGAHTGALYSASGERLCAVRFDSETGSGWQVAELPAEVNLYAGDTYVVTYTNEPGMDHAESDDESFISATPALDIATDGASVTRTAKGGFSRARERSTHYWVDVVYRPRYGPHPSWSPSPRPEPSEDLSDTPTSAPTDTPSPTPSATSPTPVPVPSEPATTKPPVTPPAKSNDAAGFPTASTTGVPAGWSPTQTVYGDYTVGDDGAVIEDLRVVGGVLYVRGTDITLRRVELVGARIVNEYAGRCYSGLKIEDSSIVKGDADLGMPAIESGGYTATRVKIDGVSEGFRVGGTDVGCDAVTIQDSWVRVTPPDDCTDNSSWHGDGLQGYLGVALIIRNTAITLVERPDCTGTAAFFYPDQGNTSATIDNVLLAGGGYAFRLGTQGTVNNLKIVADSWDFGPLDVSSCGHVAWGTGNELVRIAGNGSLISAGALACKSG